MPEETKVVDFAGFKTFEEYQNDANSKITGFEKTITELESLKGTQGRKIGDLELKVSEATKPPEPEVPVSGDDPFTDFMTDPKKFFAAKFNELLQTKEGQAVLYKAMTAEGDPEKNPFMEQRSSSNWLHAVNEHPELKDKTFQDEVKAELAKQKEAGNKITYVTAAQNVKDAKSLKDAKEKGTALTDEEKRLAQEKEDKFGGKQGGGGVGGGKDGDDVSEEDKIANGILARAEDGRTGDKEVSPI